MAAVCPSVTAYSADEYREQMEKVAHFAERIHIDLMDGQFTPKANIGPAEAWWPAGVKADFHLMYKQPDAAIDTILEHKPNLIIVHAEADGNFLAFARRCKSLGVGAGVALLPNTPIDSILEALGKIDHVLVFSGDLGQFGGHANLDLLRKVHSLKQHRPDLEVGWDGGISDQNISQLAAGGVDVFNAGGFIQDSAEPERAYQTLCRIEDETGTT